MKIGYMQFEPKLGEIDANLARIESLLPPAGGVDLLVLPELCSTGYRFGSREEAFGLSESVEDSEYLARLTEACRERGMYIVTGFNEREGEKLYNSSVLVGPDGTIGTYRKLHLFMDEKDIFEPGNLGLPIFEIAGCTIGMLVCFDWIFPETWRVLALKGADIICHPSNLVIPGLCQKSLPVHAVCNRVFVVTANRYGTEKDLTFTGLSTIADPKSNVLAVAPPDRDAVDIVEVDLTLARDKNVTPRNHVFDDRRPGVYEGLL